MNISSRNIPALALLVCLGSSCDQSTTKEVSSNDFPNIILLMGDDHGWDEVGYNGHPFVKTPVLDEMASNGLRFDRFYSAHPTCSPTRGSVLTGRHPNRYGTFTPGWSLRPEEITIAHIAKDAGYSTAHFGKWHVGPVKKGSPTNPGAMGFDEWLSHDNFFEMDPVMSRNGNPPEQIIGEGSEVIIEKTIEYIQRTKQQNQPFLAVVWFGSPHEPYSGTPEDLALYNNLPDSLNNKEVRLTSNETGEQVLRPLRDVLQERYAEITAMDRSIGKLRKFLFDNGLQENTLVLYCGDNGTCATAARTGMTLRAQKGSMYEGGVRVPGIIEWPAVIQNPESTSVVAVTSDIFPTIAEITDYSINRPIDGTSLLPFIKDVKTQRSKPVFFWQFEPNKVFDENAEPYIDPKLQEGTTPLAKKMAGLFTRNFKNFKYNEVSEDHFQGERTMMLNEYKLVVEGQSPDADGYELYNIIEDPAEKKNLSETHPEVVKEFRNKLHEWQNSVLESLKGADYPSRE